jgi:hypothetical protein
LVVDQLGDAEVQQLDLAGRRHRHIARLDVAVHHEMLVRHADRSEHLEEEPQAGVDPEPPAPAMDVDRFTIDQLDHQVGLAARRQAGVEQGRDVRMDQAAQDGALALEPLGSRMADQRQVQQLDGHLTRCAWTLAHRVPHGARTTMSQRSLQDMGAELQSCQTRLGRGCWGRSRLAGQEGGSAQLPIVAQQALELFGQCSIFLPQGCQALRALRILQPQQLIE